MERRHHSRSSHHHHHHHSSSSSSRSRSPSHSHSSSSHHRQQQHEYNDKQTHKKKWEVRKEEDQKDEKAIASGEYKYPSPPPSPPPPKYAKPARNFVPSGKLQEESALKYKGRKLLWDEPADAAVPNTRWRIYVFKGTSTVGDPLLVHRQSCYLFGRDRAVADIPIDHPSCSSQHAVLQYRRVGERILNENDLDGKKELVVVPDVRPYIMDLGSTNGTTLNGKQLPPKTYVEIKEKDVVKFAFSTRDYVFLQDRDHTKDETD